MKRKKDEDNVNYMKTNKDNIILPIINNLVNRTNKIIIHTYQFIKLYSIYLYENNQQFFIFDKEYILDIFSFNKT